MLVVDISLELNHRGKETSENKLNKACRIAWRMPQAASGDGFMLLAMLCSASWEASASLTCSIDVEMTCSLSWA